MTPIPPIPMQARLNDVRVQAIEALDCERYMLLDDIGNGSGYTHGAGSG
jgi:hypothetical protein